MRSRVACTVAAVLAGFVSAASALPATGAEQHGTLTEARTSTVRAACVGGPSITVTAQQPGDGSVTVFATAANIATDGLWSGEIEASNGGGGGGSAFGGQTPSSDGTVTGDASVLDVPDPTVTVDLHSDDQTMTCSVRFRVERQFARASCTGAGRQIAVTALRNGSHLDVTSSLQPVRKGSAWNANASVRSPHASEGAAGARHASAAGVVRSAFSFGYAANRTVTAAFANPGGKKCRISMGTHRIPPA